MSGLTATFASIHISHNFAKKVENNCLESNPLAIREETLGQLQVNCQLLLCGDFNKGRLRAVIEPPVTILLDEPCT